MADCQIHIKAARGQSNVSSFPPPTPNGGPARPVQPSPHGQVPIGYDAGQQMLYQQASQGYRAAPQVVVVKQGGGCLKTFAIVVGVLLLLGVGLIVLAGFVLNEAAEQIEADMGAAAPTDYRIELQSCSPGSFGLPEATGTITNTSSKAQGFQVDVRFTTADNTLIAEAPTFIDTLEVGQTGTWRAGSLSEGPETGVACQISVSYTIFDNEVDPASP